MRCWRVDVRSKFSRYLDGELSPREIKRLEDHLLDCGMCRAKLSRLRAGHRFAMQLPPEIPQRDVWPSIEAAIASEQSESLIKRDRDWRRALAHPGFAIGAVAVATVMLALLVAANRRSSSDQQVTGLTADAFELRDFHRVSIARIEQNTEPHVVAEGYVSEVRIDNEDGDLTFKIVDDIRQAQPFIVCEIINPKKLAPPPVGSRVRVYGVSRYDNQENHNWYEVHPVLNIEVVR
ncbi:MAG TPA: anti-sigma factor [Blastocatellia bacterium]